MAPIVTSYNEIVRPILDAIDKLRSLKIVVDSKDIELPTIVLIGDQSSGKSSVLQSLTGISLLRGIRTRVPLVMRLQSHPKTELYLEYNGKIVRTTEDRVLAAINLATEEIAGSGKRISNTPLTLTVKKRDMPDLTVVVPPGITRVPILDQPENINDQTRDIIMEYIKPESNIILNVLPATENFATCESIALSKSVDKTGERTLAVVTKSDLWPEGLREKVTSSDVNIGLGYVCLSNQIEDESRDEARDREADLLSTHPLLSAMDESMVGVQNLARKLMQIQVKSIARNFPPIVEKIDDKLSQSFAEYNRLPKTLSSRAEAKTACERILGQAKDSLRKILLLGEFNEYPDDALMHFTVQLVEMLGKFYNDLAYPENTNLAKNYFLAEEVRQLDEAKTISLSKCACLAILLNQKVERISSVPVEFVSRVWDYVEEVLARVLRPRVVDYCHIFNSSMKALERLNKKMKERSTKWVTALVRMEKLSNYYTCDPMFDIQRNDLMRERDKFLSSVQGRNTVVSLSSFGDVEIEHLWGLEKEVVAQAFDMKMRMEAYWSIVVKRLVDSVALHLQMSVDDVVNSEFDEVIGKELLNPCGDGIDGMVSLSRAVAARCARLLDSINKLKDCKQTMARVDKWY